jgi:hypothetical protein
MGAEPRKQQYFSKKEKAEGFRRRQGANPSAFLTLQNG